MNKIVKEYNYNDTWVAPAGVTSVELILNRNPNINSNCRGSGNCAIAITSTGQTYAWGANSSGGLGVGDVTNRSSPVLVLGGLSFQNVNNGLAQSNFGITTSGSLYSWGLNDFGQLGVGDITNRSSPVAVLGGLTFKQIIGAADLYSIGLTTTGAAYAWGLNHNGQLGVGDVTARSSPVLVLGGLSFQKITMLHYSSYGLTTSGALYAWGNNVEGALGVGDINSRSSPVAVLGGLTFKDIISGEYFAIGLTTTGAAYAWGDNSDGQLGVGDTTSRSSPILVLGGLTFSKIALTTNCSYGLTTSGALYGWGANLQGQLGVGNTANRSSPVLVLGGLTFKDVFPMVNSTAALTTSGTLYGCGDNSKGQLGVGDIISRSSPVAVLGGLTFKDVYSVGTSAFSGLTTSGALYAWGFGASAQLGVGDLNDRSSPVAVLGGLVFTPQAQANNLIVSVIPGTSYVITLGYNATFGNYTLGNGLNNTLTLTYKE